MGRGILELEGENSFLGLEVLTCESRGVSRVEGSHRATQMAANANVTSAATLLLQGP